MSHQQGLSEHECREHLEPGGVGRVALHTPSGLMIYPVNFTIDGRSIVFRTTTESTFGYSVVGADVVFETDYVNFGTRQGWSVVVTGTAEAIDDAEAVDQLRLSGSRPRPFADGPRTLYVRIPWREITGRAVGDEWLGSARPATPDVR